MGIFGFGIDEEMGKSLEEFKPENLPEDVVPVSAPKLVTYECRDFEFNREDVLKDIGEMAKTLGAVGFVKGDYIRNESDGVMTVQYYKRK